MHYQLIQFEKIVYLPIQRSEAELKIENRKFKVGLLISLFLTVRH